MRALILVAGKARRMGELTKSLPKTLLTIENKPILKWIVDGLIQEGIDDIILVCGFYKEKIQSYIKETFPELKVAWIENPVYESTNTAYSVWLSEEEVMSGNQEILLINGDVVLDHRIFNSVMKSEKQNVLATRLDRVAEEEVKVKLDSDQRITEIGKHINPKEAAGESIGVNRLSLPTLKKLYPLIKERIDNYNGKDEFYEADFDELINKGEDFYIADVTHLPVMEVDTPEDYEEVKDSIAGKLKSK